VADQSKKRGLMSGVFRGELLGKIDSIAGEKSKSTLERDVVNSKRINPVLTGPERTRLVNETKLFWDTYFKLAPKYQKDTKGKTKVGKSPADKVLEDAEAGSVQGKSKKSLGLVAMALAKVAAVAAVVLGAGGFAVKKVMESIDAYKKMRDEQKDAERVIKEWQKRYGIMSEDLGKKSAAEAAAGNPLQAKMAKLQQEMIDVSAREQAAQMKVRTSLGYRMSQAEIGGVSLSPTNKRAWAMMEKLAIKPFQQQKADITKQMNEVRQQINNQKKGLDEQVATNNHLSNLVKLTESIAKRGGGGSAPVPPVNTKSPSLKSDTTGAAPGGPPSMDSSRLSYYNSPGSMNTPAVVE
tara:strand:- start:5318 stop:6373 length:1056 start_codon:yes stop_codon:yes gene_type:complete